MKDIIKEFDYKRECNHEELLAWKDCPECREFLVRKGFEDDIKEAYKKGRLETIKEIVDWIEGYIKENKGINPIPTVEESVAREIQSKIQSILNQLKDNE